MVIAMFVHQCALADTADLRAGIHKIAAFPYCIAFYVGYICYGGVL